MKYFIVFIASFLMSLNAAAGTTWDQSTSAASALYSADFKAEVGSEAPAPLGFFLEQEEDETLVRVYFMNAGKLRAFDYGCHTHEDGEFFCHRENSADLGDFKPSTNIYTTADILKSVPLAVDFFAQNVAPVTSLRSVKFWESQSNLRFTVSYQKEGEAVKEFYISCHYHGAEMDCHRKRDAGSNEPK